MDARCADGPISLLRDRHICAEFAVQQQLSSARLRLESKQTNTTQTLRVLERRPGLGPDSYWVRHGVRPC